MTYDQIANDEFGMDYSQLGPNEKEWVRDVYDDDYADSDEHSKGKPWTWM